MLFAPDSGAGGPTFQRRHVTADVGLGDGDRDHEVATGDFRQPVFSLFLGAAL
jgi:hypothetical protein